MSDKCPKCGGPMVETHLPSGFLSRHWVDGDDCLRRQLAQALVRERSLFESASYWKAEFVRLQAIVDRLPKTADGVPLVPGMTVFIPHPHPSNLITEREILAPYGTLACLTKEPAHSGCCESTTHRQARECYSTREAALAESDPASPEATPGHGEGG